MVKERAALRKNQRLVEDLGEVWNWTKSVIENIVPILKVLKAAGIRFEEFIERLEAGDTVREALAGLAAGDILVEHGISGDEAANRRLAARYCAAVRSRVADNPDTDEALPDEVDEEPEVDLGLAASAPPAPRKPKK